MSESFPKTKQAFHLFLLGFLTLFLELALIRYLSGSIWNLGYFPNLVLVAAFIGMGIGFTFHHHLSSKVSDYLYLSVQVILLLLIGYLYFEQPAVPGFNSWQGDVGGDFYFTATPATATSQSFVPFYLYLLAIIFCFACLSQKTAKFFRLFSPLKAYTLDIAGSCAGIFCFLLISYFTIPALYWFLAFGLLSLLPLSFSWRFKWLFILPSLFIAIFIYHQDQRLMAKPDYQGYLETYWSPYQKIEYINGPQNPHRIFCEWDHHQHMEQPQNIPRSYYQIIHNARKQSKLPAYQKALIIGAGSGSDVSTALANQVDSIDAVEIDPIIAHLGKTHNPNRPYQDPRVNLVINDGRSFMTQTKNKYDLIIFALTDSIVKVSSMSQLRLENYLFTTDSVRQAFSLLNPSGDLVFYNFYRVPWLKEKIKQMISNATDHPANEIFKRGDFSVITVKKPKQDSPVPAQQTKTTQIQHDLPTDDWPFLYLQSKKLPPIYLYAMLSLILFVAVLLTLLHVTNKKQQSPLQTGSLWVKLAFAFMGMAFLLLETKSIIQFSLLFGTTWLNNSLVFLAILLLVLTANWVAVFIKDKQWLWVLFSCLIISTLATYVIPLKELLGIESMLFRFLMASIITFLPIFFANLIFSLTFKEQKVPEHIFGWNLIGATLGGVLEYLSLSYGYQFLAILVTVCYGLVVGFLWLGEINKSHRIFGD